MKSTTCSRLLCSALLAAGAAATAAACGPYCETIPTPEFFARTYRYGSVPDYEREENLRLWQSQTSPEIPLADIEQAVYRDSRERFNDLTWGDDPTCNRFYLHLRNTGDEEITGLLRTAKELEERWAAIKSPWYHPRHRNTEYWGKHESEADFGDIVDWCKSYRGTRMRDRYALQATRALFASRDFAACVQYVDSAFADIPDNNLMKRMARRYQGGCWSRMGDDARADSAFALAGDPWSLSSPDGLEKIADLNPGAPRLIEYIRGHARDTAVMMAAIPLARRLIRDRRTPHPGDWHFVLAYVTDTYLHDPAGARRHIYRALGAPISSTELSELARAYKMKLDAKTGHSDRLMADLKWIEGHASSVEPDAPEWVRRCRNIIYADWVPGLWRRGDHATAILLCAYADNLAPAASPAGGRPTRSFVIYDEYLYSTPTRMATVGQIRDSETLRNPTDYGCLSFQLMGSLSSRGLAAVYARIKGGGELYRFLRRYARTDRDYYYELIGTLALREEDYARAVAYLSQVSEHYLRTTNIYKVGELDRDPFIAERWRSNPVPDGYIDHPRDEFDSNPAAKLTFARHMLSYRRAMRHAPTPDERGIARLMYAIGRRNSLNECWALTQYWRGSPYMVFCPWDEYCTDGPGGSDYTYSFLYDYTDDAYEETEAAYRRERDAALAMLTTDEARARAHYLLWNLKTIARHYADTPTGRLVRSSCDRWHMWL